MTRPVHLLAVHGWGFDARCWDAWRPGLREGERLEAYDRGYFGAPREVGWPRRDPDPSDSRTSGEGSPVRVLLVHSMGPMFCPDPLLEGAHLLVVFGGFLRFHPPDPVAGRRSRRILGRMARKLEDAPGEVLNRFRQRCYVPEPAPPAERRPPDAGLLGADLERLDTEAVDPGRLDRGGALLVVHGTSDEVVAEERGRELHAALPGRASVRTVEGAGHALPFTHVERSWTLIRNVLEDSRED